MSHTETEKCITKKRSKVSERLSINQSEKTIIDVLLMSISCIAFLRGFFTDNHFSDDKFTAPNSNGSNNNKNYIKIKKLKKGISPKADTILNWINISIADALHKKYLKCINLSIILNDKNPSDIFESYCFNLDYNDTGDNDLLKTKISFSEGNNNNNNDNDNIVITPAELTNLQIFKLMKKFIILTQSLGALPTKRFLCMRLLFTDSCPLNYQPEYFIDCSNEAIATIQIPLPQYDDIIAQCGNINSSHHTLTASLISLANLSDLDNDCEKIKFDPFQLCDPNFNIDQNVKSLTSKNNEISQVTKDLENLINNHDKELHDGETQILVSNNFQIQQSSPFEENSINCTCSSNMYLEYSSIVQCTKCFRNMHKVCYSIKSDFEKFICMECSDEIKSINMNDMNIIFNIRKILQFYQYNNKNILNSLTETVFKLGFSSKTLNQNSEIVNNIINALSVLIYEGILSLKNYKSFSYNIFKVDIDGLLENHKVVKKGKYFLSFKGNFKEAEINKYLDPNFGKIKQITSFNDSLTTHNEIDADKTFVDDRKESDHMSNKKRKISKSIDIFKV